MSQENVRMPIALKGRSTRGLEERLALRFPRLTAMIARAIWRLPRHSRLRQTLIRRVVVLGWEAMNRADLDFGLALYHEDVESIFDPRAVTLGMENSRGREARRRRLIEFWYADVSEIRFDPDELIDLGNDRVLVIGRMTGTGRRSGAPFEIEWANLWTISDGLVIRDEQFADRAKALEAAGLRE
jgi:ketosteroid isomerase-like protein